MQIACTSLIASAFVLGGLLAVSLQNHIPTAEATMVLNRDNYTMMTAQTKSDEEALFVIDSLNERLLIYVTTLTGTRGKLELLQSKDLSQLFTGTPTSTGGGGGRPGGGGYSR